MNNRTESPFPTEAGQSPSSPSLYGRQTERSNTVNFSDQTGVYILYKDSKIMYVGQADNLFRRLIEHTKPNDRLWQKWNRFSWFGFKAIKDDGKLDDSEYNYNRKALIDGLEGVLIEVLEAMGNDKAGNSMLATNFIQYRGETRVEP